MTSEQAVSKGYWVGVVKAILGNSAVLEGLSEETLSRVRARQVFTISRLTLPMMLANIANAMALLIVMEVSGQNSLAVIVWAATAITFAMYTSYVWYRRRSHAFPQKLGPKTARKVVANAALLGAIWTVPGLFFLPHATGSAQSFLIVLAAGMIAGGSMALYPLPAAAISYAGIIAVGSFVGFSTTGDATLVGFAVVTLAFLFIVTTTITRHSDVFISEFVGRLELDAKNILIERLLEETHMQANDERVQSERRLAHARKLEVIGQLTGGIAHDFNNLLAAIQGHTELIALEKTVDEALTTPILESTKRGSDLVHGLLTIARKQSLQSRNIDVARLVGTLAPLLERTLGGRIQIKQRIAADLWTAFADPGHLESAVLNLALNARDAMPNGGTLTLQCMNLTATSHEIQRKLEIEPGQFVCIAISDTGHGMPADVSQRALDPFFTTKKFGDGSGLGLSSVEGFCGQSGGHLWIDSQVGKGTTVYMFLPIGTGLALPTAPAAGSPDIEIRGNGERVLVVEDDEAVRSLTTTMLDGLNYRTSRVADAGSALELLRSGCDFDLVLADVQLPGELNGLELARELRRDFGHIRIVMYSGYTDIDGLDQQNVQYPLLRKPFTRQDLAHIIGSALRADATSADAFQPV